MNEFRNATNLNYGSGMSDTFIDSIHGVSRTSTGPSEVYTDGESNVSSLVRTDRNHLTLGDSFDTVKGSKNEYVGGDLTIRIDGRLNIISGNTDAKFSSQSQWLHETSELAAARATGEVKRGFYPIGYESAKEQQSGSYASNPALQSKFFSTNSIFGGLNEDPSGNVTITRSGSTSSEGSWASTSEAGGNKSPSTQGGSFEASGVNMSDLMVSAQSKLTDIERDMPRNDQAIVADNILFATSGPPNNRPPGRIDPIGRAEILSHSIGERGPLTLYQGVPHIEEVDNHSDLPFGNIRYKAGNSFSVESGSGGINLITSGGVKLISNSNTIVGGEQILIPAKSNIRLQAGKFIGIKGDNISFDSPNQITMPSLGIQKSLIVGSGAYVNGELFVNHITAPKEIQLTDIEPETTYGELVEGLQIGVVTVLGVTYPVFAVPTPDTVKVYKHKHLFANIPLTLADSNDQVRSSASDLNKGTIAAKVPSDAV